MAGCCVEGKCPRLNAGHCFFYNLAQGSDIVKKMKPQAIVFLLLIVAVIVVGVILAFQRKGRLTQEAPAKVVATKIVPLNTKNRLETLVTYSYNVGGIDYSVTRSMEGDFTKDYPVGAPGRVRFNPDRPAEADLIP